MGRKIIIVIAASLVVAAVFIGYLRLTGTKGFSVSGVSSVQDIASGPLDPESQKIDGTIIHKVDQARYTIYDSQTKKLSRIFGFERLLNPGSSTNNWQVEKPYIHFFEKRLNCRMNAQEGIFQVDTSGGTPILQDVQFTGKVVIRIIPSEGQQFSETVILMDDLNYSSDRSEFFTNGPVELISAQSRLVGKGLLMAYDPGRQAINYFEIKQLEYLRLKNVVAHNLLGKSAEVEAEPQGIQEQATPNTPEPNTAQAQAGTVHEEAAAASKPKNAAEQRFYQCILNDSVRIVYGDQAVVEGADRININHILLGEQQNDTDEPVQEQTPSTLDGQLVAAEEGQQAQESADSAKGQPAESNLLDQQPDWAQRTSLPATPADDDAKDIVVTCRGKLIVKPIEEPQGLAAAETAQAEPANPPSMPEWANLNSETAIANEPAKKAARFFAKQIDYDVNDGSALAAGPVALRFYASADANDANSVSPVVLTAQRNAEFIPDEKKSIRQVVFHENIIGDATALKANSKSVRRLYGDTLTVDIGADAQGKNSLSHVSVNGGNVRLEAMQFTQGDKTSHVRLNCKQFDYDEKAQNLFAKGPGEIQLNNKDVAAADPNLDVKSMDFRSPCVALVNGFDGLTWRMGENKIDVDSSQESMKLSYITLKDGKPDAITNAQTMYAQIILQESPDGRTVLKEVVADNGVFMEQVGQHALKGQKLVYTAGDGWVNIQGSDSQPCFVDGVKVPTINYNLQTGQLKTKLSTSPGAVGVQK